MNGTRICIAVSLLTLLAGCTGTRREETLDAMIGQDLDVAIETLGQPHEAIELGQGRRTYVWQRTFTFDYGPPSFTVEDWRYDSTFWFEDEQQEAPARLCSTSLTVGFDLVIESWDYGCENITVERERWPTWRDRPNRRVFPH